MGHAFKARVENGRFVIDEETDLPDGTVVHLVVDENNLAGLDDMDPEERAALLGCIDESMDDEEAGRVRLAHDVLRDLRASR